MSEYCLRWNNHRPNLVTVFSELLTSEALVDVTLATDGHYIHAHKLVLSACSVYFKDLFGANPCKHPIVILKDIRIEDLKTVIDFIYRGEVNVSQDRLQDVLRTAESLRIKGLAENPRSYDEMSSHGARFSTSSLGSQATRQRSSLTDSREQSLSLEGEEEGEPVTPPSNKRRKITSSHDSSESVQEEGELDERAGREVKDEPPDEQEGDKVQRETGDQDTSSMGAHQEGSEEASTTPGTSNEPALSSAHTQARRHRRHAGGCGQAQCEVLLCAGAAVLLWCWCRQGEGGAPLMAGIMACGHNSPPGLANSPTRAGPPLSPHLTGHGHGHDRGHGSLTLLLLLLLLLVPLLLLLLLGCDRVVQP